MAAGDGGQLFLVMKVPGVLRGEASVVRAAGGTRRPLRGKVALPEWTKFGGGAAPSTGLPVDGASLGREGEGRQGEATYRGDLLSRNGEKKKKRNQKTNKTNLVACWRVPDGLVSRQDLRWRCCVGLMPRGVRVPPCLDAPRLCVPS